MKQYLDVLQKILDEGVEKESGRANMPNTIGISNATISMDLSEGFPLLTTKKMFWKGIVHELLWFLRGDTNIKYLVDNKVNIWNGDAYRWYLKYVKTLEEPDYDYVADDPKENVTRVFTMEEFIENIKNGRIGSREEYKLGDLGKVYGYQWRKRGGTFDQVADVINGLKTNPYSRYHIIDGWDKESFKDAALPVCHLLYQFIVRPLNQQERVDHYFNEMEGEIFVPPDEQGMVDYLDACDVPKFYLDLNMYQRSVDTPLGAPYNIASMSLLLMIFAKVNNMIPGVSNWVGGDTHIYKNQLDGVKEQLSRKPLQLPIMKINKELNSLDDILHLTINDFELINYKSHSKISFELSVGL